MKTTSIYHYSIYSSCMAMHCLYQWKTCSITSENKFFGCSPNHVFTGCLFGYSTRTNLTAPQVIIPYGFCRSITDTLCLPSLVLTWFVCLAWSMYPFSGCVLPEAMLTGNQIGFRPLKCLFTLYNVLHTHIPFIDSWCVLHNSPKYFRFDSFYSRGVVHRWYDYLVEFMLNVNANIMTICKRYISSFGRVKGSNEVRRIEMPLSRPSCSLSLDRTMICAARKLSSHSHAWCRV